MNSIKSLYLHFPYCRHLCNYCDFYKHKLTDRKAVEDYEDYLILQIEEHKNYLVKNNFKMDELTSFYIGGGTPSLWAKSGPRFIKTHLLNHLSLKIDCEFTIEVDPGVWTDEEIKLWQGIGVNRFSIGIQSFNKDYIEILDREHNMQEANALLEYMRDQQFNYSIDLMLGLPKIPHKKRNILQEIDELIQFNPSHFSVYILKTRSNYPHREKLPEEDEISDEYLEVCAYLNKLGYKQYEVSNFAKPTHESIHNKNYWKYESVTALGANATGLLVKSETEAIRFQWKSSGNGNTEEKLEKTSLIIEKVYMHLRMHGGLKRDFFIGDNEKKFKKLIELWESRGYLIQSEPSLGLSGVGYLMLDSLMDDMFRELTL